MDGNRHVVSDCAVGSDLVVVSTPMLQLFAGLGKGEEPVSVKAFGPKHAVERLDGAVVGRFAGPGENPRGTLLA